MLIQPLGDNIIIELDRIEESKEKQTESGIIIPASTVSDQEARQDIAKIVATGEGRTLNNGSLIPLKVKPGDRIVFNKFAGTQIVLGGKTYLAIKECDIIAILK